MEPAVIVKAVLALVFVLGLAGASLLIIKRYFMDRDLLQGGHKKRLVVAEQVYLDAKRRVVLLKKDDQEFLILLGANGETVIDADNNLIASNVITSPAKTPRLRSVLGRKKSSH